MNRKVKEPIKIKYGKKIKHNLTWLSDGHLLAIIVGRSGCGKTTILSRIVPNIAQLKHVLICSVLPGLHVHKAIEGWCKNNEVDYYFASNPEEGQSYIEEIVAKKEESMSNAKEEMNNDKKKNKTKTKLNIQKKIMNKFKGEEDDDENDNDGEIPLHLQEWSLIIFDDFTNGRKSYSDKYTKLQIKAFQMLRNKFFHMVTVTQSYVAGVDTAVRNNANLRIRFNMNDKYAIDSFRRDVFENSNISRNGYNLAEKLIARDKHGYIIVSDEKLFVGLKKDNYEPAEYVDDESEEEY